MPPIYSPTAFSKLTEAAAKGVELATAIKNAEVERTIAEMQDVADYGVLSPYATKYMKMFDGLSQNESKNLRKAIIEKLPEMPTVNVLTYFGRTLGEKLLSKSVDDRMNYLRMYMGGQKEPPHYSDLADQKILQYAEKYPNKNLFEKKNAGQLLYTTAAAETLKAVGANTTPEMSMIYSLFIDDINPAKKTEWGQMTGFANMNEGDITEKLNNYAYALYAGGKMNSEQYYNSMLANAILGKTISWAKSIPKTADGVIWLDNDLQKVIEGSYNPIPANSKTAAINTLNTIYGTPQRFSTAAQNVPTDIYQKAIDIAAKGKDLFSQTGGVFAPAGQPQPMPSSYVAYQAQQQQGAVPASAAAPLAAPSPAITAPVVPSFTPTVPATATPAPIAPIAPRPAPIARPMSQNKIQEAQTAQAKGLKKVATRDYFSEVLTNYENIPSGLSAYRTLKSSLGV